MNEQRPKIEIGYRVGMLTAVEKTTERKNGYVIWKCLCDCGDSIELDTRCLQRGTVTDCGCVSVVRPGMLDLTGQRFGKLICLELCNEKDKRGNTQWVCQCDCGNICIAAVPQLKSGYKKSCGCMRYTTPTGETILKDYVGKRFGMLTVVEYAGKRAGMHRWKCICDCGKETIVGQTLLQSGKTKSCGCLRTAKKANCLTCSSNKGFVDGTNIGMLEARMTKPPIASNTSGYNGVYKNVNGMWSAQITFKNKTFYLGSYSDVQDAVQARKKGEEMFEKFLDWYYNEYLPLREKCEIAK